MNKLAISSLSLLLLLGATGIKTYKHTYHIGTVGLENIRPTQSFANANGQLDFTITDDSIIVGRFQIFKTPSDWSVASSVTFHGTITRLNSTRSSIGRVAEVTSSGQIETDFDWETTCSFDDLPGIITFAKVTGRDRFYGKMENGKERLAFHLE